MDDQLPNTITPQDERYDRLGRELADRLGRADGTKVAASLHAHFEQDVRDWFYERVWPYFAALPEKEWSQKESVTAEFECRNAVSFFQSVRSAKAAMVLGYLPVAEAEWFVNWLLRLNLGAAAEQASAAWLPTMSARDNEGQFELFSKALSLGLPSIPGKRALLQFRGPTLDLRVQATTARAFGNGQLAKKLHDEAVSLDEGLDAAIEEYLNGGSVWYVLENRRGLLITGSNQYGALFNIWTSPEFAQEMNSGQYGGTHHVSPMSNRELEGQLNDFRTSNMGFIALDRRINGSGKIVPIEEMLAHVRRAVADVNASEIGRAFADESSM